MWFKFDLCFENNSNAMSQVGRHWNCIPVACGYQHFDYLVREFTESSNTTYTDPILSESYFASCIRVSNSKQAVLASGWPPPEKRLTITSSIHIFPLSQWMPGSYSIFCSLQVPNTSATKGVSLYALP